MDVVGQNVFGAAMSALFHPAGYTKFLIQIGHEPLPPMKGRTLFLRTERLYLPNVFKYMGHIKRMDGFVGLYRGLTPRVLGGIVGNCVQGWTSQKMKELDDTGDRNQLGDDEELVDWVKQYCKQTSQESVSRCLAVIASQPFHVIMLRSMAQFVGGEKEYDGLYSSVVEIYQHDGIKGFFAGLVPRLAGELITIWLSSLIAHLVNKYFIESKELKSYTSAACGLVISHVTYPFMLVGNVMAVSGAELVAAQPPNMPPYSGWIDCWTNLRSQGSLSRGSSLFWRRANPKVRYLN